MTAEWPADLRIVPAQESDIPLILTFIHKLAEYEKLSDEVVADEQMLRRSLFGPSPAAEVVLVYMGHVPAGYAVHFQIFSTFSGGRGMYLEDLFVEPAYRNQGIGKALLAYLAKLAKYRNYDHVNWAVLDWNQPAIDFYLNLGALRLNSWTIFRLTGNALEELAGHAPDSMLDVERVNKP